MHILRPTLVALPLMMLVFTAGSGLSQDTTSSGLSEAHLFELAVAQFEHLATAFEEGRVTGDCAFTGLLGSASMKGAFRFSFKNEMARMDLLDVKKQSNGNEIGHERLTYAVDGEKCIRFDGDMAKINPEQAFKTAEGLPVRLLQPGYTFSLFGRGLREESDALQERDQHVVVTRSTWGDLSKAYRIAKKPGAETTLAIAPWEDSRELICLMLPSRDPEKHPAHRVILDPEKGYGVVRVEMIFSGGFLYRASTYQYDRNAAGQWEISQFAHDRFRFLRDEHGKRTGEVELGSRYSFAELAWELGVPVSPDEFTVEGIAPQATLLQDHRFSPRIETRVGGVDEAETKEILEDLVSKETQESSKPLMGREVTRPSDVRQTEGDSSSISGWLIWGLIVLCALGVIVACWFWRRKNQKPPSASGETE